MNKVVLIFVAIFSISFCSAQRDKIWVTSDSSVVEFTGTGCIVITNAASTKPGVINTSTLCSENGDLLLYYDSYSLYNRYNNPIPGLPSNGWLQGYQLSILLPDLIKKELVHLFFIGNASGMPLYYVVINTSSNNDSGLVISGPTLIYTPIQGTGPQVSQGLSAVPDFNNKYWWLIAQEAFGNRFVKFKVGDGLIEGPFYQDVLIGLSYSGKIFSAFSNNGDRYAYTLVNLNGDRSIIVEQDFDRCSGFFSNVRALDSTNTNFEYGIPCYSPNDSLLYINEINSYNFNLLQYDLFVPNTASSKQILYSVTTPNKYLHKCIRISVDNKLYIGEPAHEISYPAPSSVSDTGYYAVVHNPNVYGPGCNFEDKFLMMPGVFYGDIPNMPLYTTPPLTAQQADCGYDTFALTLGDSVLLGQPDTSLGKCTFAWFPSTGLNNANLAQPWCKPSISGWYHLIVHDTTLSSPCAQTEDSVYVQVNAVGLEELLDGNASAWYPNPGTGTFWLRVQLPPGVVLTCTVTDLAGREVASTLTSDSEGLRLTLPDAPAGVYFIRTLSAAEGNGSSSASGSVRMDKVVVL